MINKGLLLPILCLACFSCVYHDLSSPALETFSCDTISWVKDIQPILASSCAVDGCHDGVSRLDWRDHHEVKNFSATVRSKIIDRGMPPDSALSQHHINIIVCWIDKGLPEN